MINCSELRQHILASEVSEHVDALMSVVEPAIRLTTHPPEKEPPLGGTRLGGLPDLPPGVEWPVIDGVLLEFVGQFCLEDLAPYDEENRLPPTGMLYFFFDGMLTGYDQGKSPDRRAVLYYDGPRETLTRHAVPDHDYGYHFEVFRPCRLDVERVQTLPPFEEVTNSNDIPSILPLFPYSEWEKYAAVRAPLFDYAPRLLGHPDEIQGGEMRLCVVSAHDLEGHFASDGYGNYANEEDLIAEMKRWRLLAQFPGDNNTWMSWGCGGMIYYWIRDEDLAARRFDRVYGELVSS